MVAGETPALPGRPARDPDPGQQRGRPREKLRRPVLVTGARDGPSGPEVQRRGGSREKRELGQVNKGVWWMPWHQEAMKDVGACDKPRRAGKRAMTRGFPNGETRSGSCWTAEAPTRGTEPSQYPAEKKSNETPLVVASERGRAQTLPVQACRRCWEGVVGLTG